MDRFEQVLETKYRDILMRFQKVLHKISGDMTDVEMVLINGIMMCDAESECTFPVISESDIWEEELHHIKTNHAGCIKDTFISLQKEKALDNFFKIKREGISNRAAKVIYYLRNLYLNSENECTEVPNFIIQLMCGFDPEDEDLDSKYCQISHKKGSACLKFGGSTNCGARHYDLVKKKFGLLDADISEAINYIIQEMR